MQVHTHDAHQQLNSVIGSIQSSPRSWKGWTGLRIEAGEYLSDKEFDEATLPIKAIIGSYLRELEGAAFFYANKYIYLICKGPQRNILKQTAEQMSELVFEDIYLSSSYEVYDLSEEAEKFGRRAFWDIVYESGENLQEEQGAEPELTDVMRAHTDSANLRVLLVEDDAVVRWMIRNALKNECDFAAAPTAQGLFQLYSDFKPDIVFLDIGLPDDYGPNVLDWIMQHDPDAHVIMLSAQDNLEHLTLCLGKGAKGFIAKPFLKENLLHYIHGFQKAG